MEPNSMDSNQNMNTARTGEGSVGPVIATIIILAVIVLGGLYFWGQRDTNVNDSLAPNATSTEGLSDSDDTSSIEADLDNTDINDADFDIQAS